MPDNALIVELANRLNGVAIVGSDVTDFDLSQYDFESLVAYVVSFYEKKEGVKILDRAVLAEIASGMGKEKAPVQVEVLRASDFKPIAKYIEPKIATRDCKYEKTTSGVSDFADYFNDRLEKIRKLITGRGTAMPGMINRIENLKNYSGNKELSIIGMVYDKRVARSGNIIVTLEDESGTTRVLFTKNNRSNKETFEHAQRIIADEVVAVRGRIWKEYFIADSFIWPDIPIRSRKRTEEDMAIAFISDIHVGSKLFLERQFARFIEWLNGGVDYRKDLAGKVKYIVASGDLVDGIGIYPNQDKELSIPDIYKQYSTLFHYLSEIPEYIHVFVMPGNHDAVQRAEPQPPLTSELMSDFRKENIHIISNPGFMDIHGLKTIGYHGTSLDSIIHNVPGCSYNRPELAMVEALRRRHLSPVYGGNIVVPSKRDPLVIEDAPDILHMGHIHKNAVTDYHGTLVINSGTWQARTSYQLKQGHMPTPCILSVYETKSTELTNIDFNMV